SHHLFGCFGIKHGEYSIFNKKYTPEAYEKLATKIIEHMQRTGEYGEFFPTKFSPFGYNETTASEYFPLTKEQSLAKGWKWIDEKNESATNAKKIPGASLPKNIKEVTDDILNDVIECQESGKLFKIQKMELAFYRKMKIPLPKVHPDVRHFRRLAERRP